MDKKSIVELKSELLCRGIKANQDVIDILKKQYPTNHDITGNHGVELLIDKDKVVTVPCGYQFCKLSPFSLETQGSDVIIKKYDDEVHRCKIVEPPNWISKYTQSGTQMSDILIQGGTNTLITAIYETCEYFKEGKQCKFCAVPMHMKKRWKEISDVVETTLAAYKENKDYGLHLTGGNTNSPDRGMVYYFSYVSAIREQCDIPISLELSPPKKMYYIDEVIRLGANGFSMNIEVWDDKKRSEICPAKSQIPKQEYIDTWKYSVKELGEFTVSSALPVGLDKLENTIEGITKMIELGVKPGILPFKPFDGCKLQNYPPTSSDELNFVCKRAAQLLKEAGVDPKKFMGCERCGACGVEKDYMQMIE